MPISLFCLRTEEGCCEDRALILPCPEKWSSGKHYSAFLEVLLKSVSTMFFTADITCYSLTGQTIFTKLQDLSIRCHFPAMWASTASYFLIFYFSFWFLFFVFWFFLFVVKHRHSMYYEAKINFALTCVKQQKISQGDSFLLECPQYFCWAAWRLAGCPLGCLLPAVLPPCSRPY